MAPFARGRALDGGSCLPWRVRGRLTACVIPTIVRVRFRISAVVVIVVVVVTGIFLFRFISLCFSICAVVVIHAEGWAGWSSISKEQSYNDDDNDGGGADGCVHIDDDDDDDDGDKDNDDDDSDSTMTRKKRTMTRLILILRPHLPRRKMTLAREERGLPQPVNHLVTSTFDTGARWPRRACQRLTATFETLHATVLTVTERRG